MDGVVMGEDGELYPTKVPRDPANKYPFPSLQDIFFPLPTT